MLNIQQQQQGHTHPQVDGDHKSHQKHAHTRDLAVKQLDITQASSPSTATVASTTLTTAAASSIALSSSISASPSSSPRGSPHFSQFLSASTDQELDRIHLHPGLDLWQTWLKKRRPSNGTTNTATTRTTIAPGLLLEYLESVIVPLEASSCPCQQSVIDIQEKVITSEDEKGEVDSLSCTTPRSMIQIYIVPILKLWQKEGEDKFKQIEKINKEIEEEHREQQQQDEQEQEKHRRHSLDRSSKTSSPTTAAAPGTSGFPPAVPSSSRSSSCLVNHTTMAVDRSRPEQQGDHLRRLYQLEQSHKESHIVISQLQDKIQHILQDSSQNKNHDSDDDHAIKDTAPSVSHPSASTEKFISSLSSRSRHYNQSRADELIAAIARGLDEYHTRMERDNDYFARRQQEHSYSSFSSSSLRRHGQHHQQQQNGARCRYCPRCDCNQSKCVHMDTNPSFVHREHGAYQHMHSSSSSSLLPHEPAGFRQEDSVVIHQGHRHVEEKLHRHYAHESKSPVPEVVMSSLDNRKRSSSMSGADDTLGKEIIKQPRSCSPLRPGTSSGATAIEERGSSTTMVPGDAYDGIESNNGTHVDTYYRTHSLSRQPSQAMTVSRKNPLSMPHPDDTVMVDSLASPLGQYGARDSAGHPHGSLYEKNGHGSCGHRDILAPQESEAGRQDPGGEYWVHHEQQQSEEGYPEQEPQQDHPEYHRRVQQYHPMEEANDPHQSPYFQSTTRSTNYRNRHSKDQASYSSQRSYTHSQEYRHQYSQHERNGSRTYLEYDQQQHHHYHDVRPAEFSSSYVNQPEEDVKPLQSQQQQHRHHHHQHHRHPSRKHQYHGSHGNNSRPGPCATPIYVMNRQVNTVPELWKEWTVGLGGHPSIRQLEAQYGPSWRTSSSAANFFSRRLRIINEIQRMIDFEGLSEEEAVNRLEARREQGVVIPRTEGMVNVLDGDGETIITTTSTVGGSISGSGMSLHRLSEILRKKQL